MVSILATYSEVLGFGAKYNDPTAEYGGANLVSQITRLLPTQLPPKGKIISINAPVSGMNDV